MASGQPGQDRGSHGQALWDALNQARAGKGPQPLDCAEDAVFRYYLPMARAFADESDTDGAAGPGVDDAVQLGLAEAVLAWRHRESDGFDKFARTSIEHRLRGLSGTRTGPAGHLRLAQVN